MKLGILTGAAVALCGCFFLPVLGVELCSVQQGLGYCPDHNTCCPLATGGSGCIPSDLGAYNGTCCSDGITGCAVGYTCGPDQKCYATEEVQDPIVQVLPRYILCHPSGASLSTLHGLPIVGDAKLAYYSSHGDLFRPNKDWSGIQIALVVIHGAGRDADNYLCAASTAVELQKRYPPHSILVIVPKFLSTADGPVVLAEGGTPLRWDNVGFGPWRYGAYAVEPPFGLDVSSFQTVDVLMQLLHNRTHFPGLRHATIAGHSSGGQFVQRWTMLTSTWDLNRTSSVVMNPSSYAYLTPLRLIHGTWQIPVGCPEYNEWEWGFDDGGDMIVHYKDLALEKLGYDLSRLIDRFGDRKVTYLSGSIDCCNVSGVDGWCKSHGLEVTCMDEAQGSNRLERGDNYFESLREIVGIHSHERLLVDGATHDHALMMTSATGISVFFPNTEPNTDVE